VGSKKGAEQQLCHFWPEIPTQTKQSEWDHHCNKETNVMHLFFGFLPCLPVDTVEYLNRNVGSHCYPWE
jgi:hypothetical protein